MANPDPLEGRAYGASWPSSSSFGTCPAAKCHPLGCSWKTCLRASVGRYTARVTRVWVPSGATSHSLAAIWGNSPLEESFATAVGDPISVYPAAAGSRYVAAPGSTASTLRQLPPPAIGLTALAVA